MKDIFLVDADDTVLDFHGASAIALKIAFENCNLEWKESYADAFKTFFVDTPGMSNSKLIKLNFFSTSIDIYSVFSGNGTE